MCFSIFFKPTVLEDVCLNDFIYFDFGDVVRFLLIVRVKLYRKVIEIQIPDLQLHSRFLFSSIIYVVKKM